LGEGELWWIFLHSNQFGPGLETSDRECNFQKGKRKI
jgi:hypothetical protein